MTDQRRRSGGLETLALIAAGGFLGSLARYGVATLVSGPAGTFLVNVTGSAALGFVFYAAATTDRIPERVRLLVTVGFLSSYTTYSTFALETMDVDPAVGVVNVLGSYAGGFSAVLVGRRIALGGGR
ncbi:fluoride efflux transporter FluC [Halalkalicoccus salilacus]|uniref:fluoride efflux transporter FluC n=1 Tax=Halalkalicoccus TaxID=332246 RepID=UPI002F96654B